MISSFELKLPFGLGGVTLKPDESEKIAAWNLYIELVTRVATQDLAAGEGLDRDALQSLYSLFPSTRRVLRAAGPGAGVGPCRVGRVAIKVLNDGLRPFLTKWHGRLTAWEQSRKPGDAWTAQAYFRSELAHVSQELNRYAEELAIFAGVGDQL